jgi:hypothetical protein
VTLPRSQTGKSFQVCPPDIIARDPWRGQFGLAPYEGRKGEEKLLQTRPLRAFIGGAIRRSELVHEPIVRRPAHARRLVGILIIGRVAAKRQAQLASAPEGSVKFSLSLGGVGKLICVPRPKVTATERQV